MLQPLSTAEIEAILLSLKVSGLGLIVSLPLAVFAAYALARWRFIGHSLLDAVIHMPLVLPPVVTGFTLLILFGRRGPIGSFLYEQFGITLAFRWTGAAVVAGVMAFPLIVRTVRLAFEAVDPKLEQAAETLGAPRIVTFFVVTLPLAAPGIVGGAMLGFAKAMGEFGATITFASNIPGQTRTMSLAIYTFTQSPDGDLAALRLSIAAAVIAFAAVIASEFVSRRLNRRVGGA
ncbi:molybdate ABC transporter permease subunit [Breoghania sp.]|uniref:molybdate ABC transporter permease subunit n=1 Tax=Breoghania sp. TaxID=2065378 RepID=UPI002AA6A363|nr:molybdate ABC transporter permease subunit [Breoghania sp.]